MKNLGGFGITWSRLTPETMAKEVLPNIHRRQAAVSVHSRHSRWPRNGPVCCLSFAAYGARLTMHCQWGRLSSFSFFLSLVTLTFYFWPWHSNSSEWGSTHVLSVNFAQISLAVPEIFEAQSNKQTNKTVTDGAKTEPCAVQWVQ